MGLRATRLKMELSAFNSEAEAADEQAARALSESLGASDFKMRSHHP